MQEFYVQITAENRVTDIITYPYENYVKVLLETPLPIASYSGIYELTDGVLVYRPDWDTGGILKNQGETESITE